MEDMIRISALCVGICILVSLIGQGSRVMASIVIIASGAVLLCYAVQKGGEILNEMRQIAEASGISGELTGPVFKVLGIALCGKMTAELCRDMGSRWAACNIELFAVIASVISMMPLIEEVLRLVGSI